MRHSMVCNVLTLSSSVAKRSACQASGAPLAGPCMLVGARPPPCFRLLDSAGRLPTR